MKSTSVLKMLLGSLFLLAAFPVFAGPPQDVEYCPYLITEPGKYRLANDLVDCVGFGVGILASDVTIDLRGHTISCADTVDESGGVIAQVVNGVKIKNGYITGCAGGVFLAAVEDSSVTEITTWGNYSVDSEEYSGIGIFIYLGGNNVIMHNLVYGNERAGINSLLSSGNLIKHNTSIDNIGVPPAGWGIALEGESNSRVTCNRLYGNLNGIWLGSDSTDNLLRGNLAVENFFSGIGMVGHAPDGLFESPIPGGNLVKSNITEGNWGFDFLEAYYDSVNFTLLPHPEGTCRNAWEKNQFGPSVLGPDGCFGSPVMLEEDDVCALDDSDD